MFTVPTVKGADKHKFPEDFEGPQLSIIWIHPSELPQGTCMPLSILSHSSLCGLHGVLAWDLGERSVLTCRGSSPYVLQGQHMQTLAHETSLRNAHVHKCYHFERERGREREREKKKERKRERETQR